MEMVIIVVVLALIQYIVFSILVGRARGKYDVQAPATSGDPVFDRYFRVQQNTLEQLVVFLPAIFIYSQLGNPMYAADFGVVYLIGRIIYFRSYVKDPGSRGLGFMLTFLPSVIMLIGALFMAARDLLAA